MGVRTGPACLALVLAPILCCGKECRGSTTLAIDLQGAVWIVPWSDWQYLSEAGPLPPLSNLKFFKTDRRAPSLPPKSTGPTLLKVHEIQGEWARVSGPEPGTSILDVDNGEATADQNPGYLIHWTAKPLGWIRWRIPGPVPGTKLCAVELDWMGVVD